jgi:hypothetical protein
MDLAINPLCFKLEINHFYMSTFVRAGYYSLAALFFGLVLPGFDRPTPPKAHWKSLFNGRNLQGWDTWLGVPFDSAGNRMNVAPSGLNNDPKQVFSVVTDSDGKKVIRISGQQFGALVSKEEYENYHLQLQFKWGDLTWAPKKKRKKDSGLLYHSVGEHSGDNGFWMRSQEFQIEQGNVGDYWGVSGAFEDVPADKINDSTYVYDQGGTLYTFSTHTPPGRHCIKKGDAEKPTGEWNTLDLYCHGDTSVQVVNGQIMMVLYHSQQWDNGSAKPLTKGKLQIQSEGAEVYFKNIRITTLYSLSKILGK